MSGRIFISYRKLDDPGFAGRLYDRLKQKFTAPRVFMDVSSLRAGTEFEAELKRQVEACDVLLAIIGRDWLDILDDKGTRRLENADDWVRLEIETALRMGKHVIPVLVNAAPPPPKDRLPHELQSLMGRQYERLTHEKFDSDALALIGAVEQSLEESREQREREEKARKAQTDKLLAGRPLDKAEIDGRVANALVPEFGLRLMPRGVQGFPRTLGPPDSLYCCVGDYAEHRGRFMKDIMRDLYNHRFPRNWYAIKFRIGPGRLAEFGLLPATHEALHHIAQSLSFRQLDPSEEAAARRFSELAQRAEEYRGNPGSGQYEWASKAWKLVRQLLMIDPEVGRISRKLTDEQPDLSRHMAEDRLFTLLFGVDSCFGGAGRGHSDYASRHFLVRNGALDRLDFEVQQLGTADDLVILA